MQPIIYLQMRTTLSRAELADQLKQLAANFGGSSSAVDGSTLRRWAEKPERMPRWARLAAFALAAASGYEARSTTERADAIRSFRVGWPRASFDDLLAYSESLFRGGDLDELRSLWSADVARHALDA